MEILIWKTVHPIVSINFTTATVIIIYIKDNGVASMTYSQDEFKAKMKSGEIAVK